MKLKTIKVETKIHAITKVLQTNDWWACCDYGPSFNCGKKKPKFKVGDLVRAKIEVHSPC